jgi:hypothetical protein
VKAEIKAVGRRQAAVNAGENVSLSFPTLPGHCYLLADKTNFAGAQSPWLGSVIFGSVLEQSVMKAAAEVSRRYRVCIQLQFGRYDFDSNRYDDETNEFQLRSGQSLFCCGLRGLRHRDFLAGGG